MSGEVLNDKEGIESLAKLGENMAVLLQKIKYFGGTNG